ETARSLGVAVGTVKARLHRGRALLRKKLEPYLEDESGWIKND
ncbi:MAG: RNA polymerase subunit sigma-70, partial [Planctomycetes bacterium]|nr:RNA polymerase subunit sigma-70 [Planctomycetota bacterium]